MKVGASGGPAPDIAAVRAAAPETDAVTAATRAASRSRTIARPAPAMADGFGAALASAVEVRWPAREDLAKRGEGLRREQPTPRDTSNDGTAPIGSGTAARATTAPAANTLGGAAMRTLVRDVIGAGPEVPVMPLSASTAAAAAPGPAAPAPGLPEATVAAAAPAAMPLPAEVAWQLVAAPASEADAEPADTPLADALAPATTLAAALVSSVEPPAPTASSAPTAGTTAAPASAADAVSVSAPALPRATDRVTVQFGGDDGPAGTVRLALRGDNVHATIVAPTHAEAETLAHGLAGLKRALHEQGFTGAQVSVHGPRGTTANAPSASTSHSSADTQTPRDPRRSRDDAEARRALRDAHASFAMPEEEGTR